jgi:hypothetical protein
MNKKKELEQLRQDSGKSIVKSVKPQKPKAKAQLKMKDTVNANEALQEERRRKVLERKAALYEKLKSSKTKDLTDKERAYLEAKGDDILLEYSSSDDDDSESYSDLGQPSNAHADSDMIETVDEFGRTRLVKRSAASTHSTGTNAIPDRVLKNTKKDFKEYTEAETTGYHMFPPQYLQSTRLREETLKREQEAKNEWQSILSIGMNKSKKRKDHNAPDDIFQDGNEHYDAATEVRNLGTGFFKFSHSDEEERRKQMEALQELRKETQEKQKEIMDEKEKRKQKVMERMQQVKKRKLQLQNKSQESLNTEVVSGKPSPSTFTDQELKEAEDFLKSIF